MATFDSCSHDIRRHLRSDSSTGEVPAPIRSLSAVALTAALYGLLVLMTVMYEWSLGAIGGITP